MSLQLIDIIRKKSSNTIFIMLLPEEGSFDALFRSKPHWSTFQTTLPVPKFTDRSHEDLRPLVVRTKDAQGISIDPADEEQVIDCLSRQAVKTLTLFDDADNVAKVLQNACEKMKRRIIMNANSEDLQICQEKAEWCWEQAVRQLDEGGSKRRQNLKVPLKSAPPPLAKTCDDPKSSPPRLALTLEDVAGPPVPDLKAENKSWQQLQSMTGLDNVKEEFAQMIDYAQRKKESERLGLEAPRAFSLHRTFLGPPGVGKTTVAKLYGQLILDLGLVSGLDSKSGRHKEPTVVDPSHLIGAYTGWSESRTKSYLSKAQGGVLIIDEAHMLYTSRANGENSSDVFRKAVIDTIVANVTADTDEDRCVILAGYPDHMEDMFLHSNPGLQRRFPKETAMHFEAYTTDQLLQIFSTKLDAEKTKATDEALQVAKQVLTRMRINPQFGNAGDVENLLATARRRNLGRNPQSSWASSPARPLQLEPEDIDPRWDRLLNADGNRAILFEKYVGFEEITDKFERYKNTVVGMKKRGVDPRAKMPWNFIFEGPPGTGKTSTARKLGQLYFDLCLLSTDEVVECSVGDLLDMSGLKVINMLEKGLGKVLFIDEAYRLKGTTAGQLITGELVDAVTKKRYAGNLVIVLAGYTKEMDSLLGTNSGLRSRFSERIRFPTLKSKACKSLLEQELRRNEITIQESPRGAECRLLARGFHRLRGTKAWASGRDVETLARSIANLVFAEEGRNSGGDPSGTLTVSTAEVLRQMRIMYEERASQEVDDAAPRQTRQEDSDAE
jgi:SpoVK/Ycf46/Vps4 family AAA+-type ATPase